MESRLATCRLHGVGPSAYPADVPRRVDERLMSALGTLNVATARELAARVRKL